MDDWLYQTAVYAEYLPIVIALARLKYLDNALKWFLFGTLISTFCSIISMKLGEKGINNHFMIYINASTLFIFRTLFFYYLFQAKKIKKALIICLIIYLAIVLYDIFTNGIYMNEYLFSIYDIWLIIFCLIALYKILNDESIEYLRNYPSFWIIMGTLIFIIFDFLLTLLNSWLYAINRSFFFVLWNYIVPIFMIFRIIMLCIGFWKTKKYE
jgi:hypothetical protein